MLFSSLFFIYVFLPLTLLLYFGAADRFRNLVLLVTSLIFYAWAEPRYLLIIISVTLINYLAALLIDRYRRLSRILLIACILCDIAILGYFKYFSFILENLNAAFACDFVVSKIVLPIGISFYTFQSLSYVIDVYRREVRVQKDVLAVALYVVLFPQLVAGPIVKYHDIEPYLDSRTVTFSDFAEGMRRFLIGLGKKVLIANNMGLVADRVFSQPVSEVDTGLAWIGAFCYSLQIFYDFSGYSDMAIGLGRMFGFRFLENFNYPYISASITEFWRRWHISLSTWFKHYVYIPLGGNRLGTRRTCVNLMIVFFITGLWHGAEWTFVIWGLWHGAFIVLEKLTGLHMLKGGFSVMLFRHLLTLTVVLVGWVIFRADNLSQALLYLQNMFGFLEHTPSRWNHAYFYDNLQIIAAVIGVVFALPWFCTFMQKHEGSEVLRFAHNLTLIGVLVISTAFLTAGTYNPFIYFRF